MFRRKLSWLSYAKKLKSDLPKQMLTNVLRISMLSSNLTMSSGRIKTIMKFDTNVYCKRLVTAHFVSCPLLSRRDNVDLPAHNKLLCMTLFWVV